MSNQSLAPVDPNRKVKVLVIGGVLGALVGLAGAYMLAQSAERSGEEIEVSPGEGIKLAVLVFGLLRSVATLHEGK